MVDVKDVSSDFLFVLRRLCTLSQTEAERSFCPPPGVSHRLFTASLHVGTVYEPRGRRCQDATSSQQTSNLSQAAVAAEEAETQRANRESFSLTVGTLHLQTLIMKPVRFV